MYVNIIQIYRIIYQDTVNIEIYFCKKVTIVSFQIENIQAVTVATTTFTRGEHITVEPVRVSARIFICEIVDQVMRDMRMRRICDGQVCLFHA